MTRHKKKAMLILIVLVVVTIVITRIPFFPHEKGIDSFHTHDLSTSIQNDHFAKWIMNPLSVMGLFPYSYPAGIPFTLVVISDVLGVTIEQAILLLSIILALVGSLGIFLFVYEFSNNRLIAILATIIYLLSPIFLDFTLWSMSTRAPYVAILPFAFWSILMYEKTSKNTFLGLFLLLLVVESTVHRMFLFLLLCVIPSYFAAKFILHCIKKHQFFKQILPLLLISTFIIFFLVQFSNLGPYKTYKWTYRTGAFFGAGTINDYRTGSLNNLVLLANMLIDYASNFGLASIFVIVGAFYFVRRIFTSSYSFKDLFVVMLFIFTAPVTMYGYYTSIFYLPLFSLLSALGFAGLLLLSVGSRKLVTLITASLVVISIFFSYYMVFHWISIFPSGPEKPWVSDHAISAAHFLDTVQSKGTTLTSSDILNARLRAFSKTPILSASYGDDINLLAYDLVTRQDIGLDSSFTYLFTPTKSFLRPNRSIYYYEQDWEALVAHGMDDQRNIRFRTRYNLTMVLEETNVTYVRDTWLFYKDVKSGQNKIFENGKYEIWNLGVV